MHRQFSFQNECVVNAVVTEPRVLGGFFSDLLYSNIISARDFLDLECLYI